MPCQLAHFFKIRLAVRSNFSKIYWPCSLTLKKKQVSELGWQGILFFTSPYLSPALIYSKNYCTKLKKKQIKARE